MTKLMIFDLDGTLLDTIRDLAEATNHVLAAHGYPTHSTEAYHYFVGNGVRTLISRSLPEQARTPERIEQFKEEQVAYYHEHMYDHTRPFPGMQQVLAALQGRGIKLAVVSNKVDEAVQQMICDFFPEIRFEHICGQRDGIPHKPDPTMVNLVIAEAGVSKAEVLYFGDSDVDMQTAHNAGVKGIGVLWGYRTKEELQSAGAYAVLDKVEDLLDQPER